jgi:DNA-nicking Smr family endonuclease
MDFGEILKKWENRQTGKPVLPNTSQKSDMETWLKNNEIIDKDADTQRNFAPGEKRRRLLNKKPDDVFDIHGLTSEKAWSLLEQFFENAKNNGCEKLRIIHGKGNHTQGEAILGSIVKKFIEQCSYAGESGYENSSNGGTGATWVLLKETSKN